MGLAQLMERPRNWNIFEWSMNDAIGVADTLGFFSFTDLTINTTEAARNTVFPYDVVVERFWIKLRANSLDALSTNTITLRINAATTAHALVFTDSTGLNQIIELSGISQLVEAGELMNWIWTSDSVGTMLLASAGCAYRIVNPSS